MHIQFKSTMLVVFFSIASEWAPPTPKRWGETLAPQLDSYPSLQKITSSERAYNIYFGDSICLSFHILSSPSSKLSAMHS